LLRRKAAKGGKKYAGWKHTSTVQAIANILVIIVSVLSLVVKDMDHGNLHAVEQEELFLVSHQRISPSTSHLW
jgi:hypothetical protein